MSRIVLKSLEVDRILDLAQVGVEFHPRVSVLVGQNKAGKTLICASSVLALLGLQAAANRGLNSTHWGGKVTKQNLARRGERNGRAKLSLCYEGQDYTFGYYNRPRSPHEACGPEGQLDPDAALRRIGVDVRAVSFLTTSERRPPWMTLDGDGKTPDIRTVLRQSLETSLATQVDGCKGVRELVAGEESGLKTEIQGLRQQLLQIVNDWVSAGALSESERTQIPSVECVETRCTQLTELSEILRFIHKLIGRLRDLAKIATELSNVEELPKLVSAEATLRELTVDLGERAKSLRVFDTDRLKSDMPNSMLVISNPLNSELRRIAKRGRLLASCHQRLKGQDCLISSFDELGAMEAHLTDQSKKLRAAKRVTEEERQPVQVACMVYLGKPVLVELPGKLTAQLSAEELASAQVIAPYDQAKDATANRISKLIGYYKKVNDKLHLNIEQARGLASEEQDSYGQKASNMRPTLGGIIVELRSVGCSEEKLPNAQTGDGLPEAKDWVESEWQQDWLQLKEKTGKAAGKLVDVTMGAWAQRIRPVLNLAEGLTKGATSNNAFDGLLQEANKLEEAARCLGEHKERFNNLKDDINSKEVKSRHYQQAVNVLASYFDKLRFSDEDIDSLTQRFVNFVREGKRFFGFNFDFNVDDKGNLLLKQDGIEGQIQTSGGESQILGLLEMLAVATEFGFPIIIDEVENYLDSANLRKALSFIFNETDVQMVVTSRDEALSSHLREWGIDHAAYRVTKEADGLTRVSRMQFPS